ncbi:MAG: site-specific DNA-methyltransferase, partial [Lentisphaerae bacterium]|nr:site-specific DNA-methyltransferase [Lentisphaerota bacterium]
MIETYFKNDARTFGLSNADCVEVMAQIAKSGFKFDMVFADPPYFLSSGGISVQSGKQVCVDKGEWDKSQGSEKDLQFT